MSKSKADVIYLLVEEVISGNSKEVKRLNSVVIRDLKRRMNEHKIPTSKSCYGRSAAVRMATKSWLLAISHLKSRLDGEMLWAYASF